MLICVPGSATVYAVPGPAPAKCSGPAILLLSNDYDQEHQQRDKRLDTTPPPDTDRGFDVLACDLDLRINPTDKSIDGQVTLEIQALANLPQNSPLRQIQLDLVEELVVSGISNTVQELEFSHINDALLVNLPTALLAEQTTSLTISWSGNPPRHGNYNAGLLFRSHNSGTDNPDDDKPVVASISEPWSAHSWWPCKDHPADKFALKIAITVPAGLTAVSNGQLISVDEVEPDWVKFSWEEQYSIATYLVSVAISNYESWTEDCFVGTNSESENPLDSNVPLHYHVFPQDLQVGSTFFAPTCEVMIFFTGLFGPYPFTGEKYAQAEVRWGGAMENQTATSIAEYMITDDDRFTNIIVHELAHHWFGDSLTPAVWSDIWLNEGFARYSEALWVEFKYGQAAYQQFMREIGQLRHPALFYGEGTLAHPVPVLPNVLIYNKGAWILHLLRMYIGDESFFECLNSYANDSQNKFGSVTTADFIAAAEAASGQYLGDFFTPWLETDLAPIVTHQVNITNHQNSGNVQVQINFSQSQSPLFSMAVPVVIHTQSGVLQKTAYLNEREESVSWLVNGPVSLVAVDPDSMALMWQTTAPEPAMAVTGPSPNPISGQTAEFRIYLLEESRVKTALYDIKGHKLNTWDLGILNYTGPAGDEENQPHRWSPTLTSATGRTPATGVYWLEFTSNRGHTFKKFTILK